MDGKIRYSQPVGNEKHSFRIQDFLPHDVNIFVFHLSLPSLYRLEWFISNY